MEKIKDISAVILCGGKSRRMGYNKAFLTIGEKTIITIIFELVSSLFENIIISTNEPELYANLNSDIVTDIYPNQGPLSGIHSSLLKSSTERNLFISCDLPLLNKDIISAIISCKCSRQILLLNINGKIQFNFGIYNKFVSDQAGELLFNGDRTRKPDGWSSASIKELLKLIHPEIIPLYQLGNFDENIFKKMNTLEEYEYIKSFFNIMSDRHS